MSHKKLIQVIRQAKEVVRELVSLALENLDAYLQGADSIREPERPANYGKIRRIEVHQYGG